jgi:hypothetical protein
MLTTRIASPVAASRAAASIATPTSEPVAISVIASRASLSRSTDAPRRRSAASNDAGRSSAGSVWRESAKSVGPSARSSATPNAAAVSSPSAGRITSRFGMSRSADRCSTAWCVGPSSPRKMLSCVYTHSTRSFISAASRIEGRA